MAKKTYPDGNEVAFSQRSANGWQQKLILMVTRWHFLEVLQMGGKKRTLMLTRWHFLKGRRMGGKKLILIVTRWHFVIMAVTSKMAKSRSFYDRYSQGQQHRPQSDLSLAICSSAILSIPASSMFVCMLPFVYGLLGSFGVLLVVLTIVYLCRRATSCSCGE